MGHICKILTFSEKEYSNKQISVACDRWANYNCDPEESGFDSGLPFPINFTKKIFESYEDACEYLEGTYGNYKEIAVRFKEYSEVKPTVTIKNLEKRISDYRKKLNDINNNPHYKNVKVAHIKCQNCGTVYPTSYCGKSFYNTCLICHKDLRPKTILEKIENYKNTLKELEKKLKTEQEKLNKKEKYELYWAVACEVHC